MTDASKITAAHTQRAAFVYIRQSSPSQVENNRESTARRYALVDRACELGWGRDQVIVIDEDLGVSGASGSGDGHDLLRTREILDALKRNRPPRPTPAAELAQESARATAAAVSGFPRPARARSLRLGTTDRPGENHRDRRHGSPDGQGRRGRPSPGASR